MGHTIVGADDEGVEGMARVNLGTDRHRRLGCCQLRLFPGNLFPRNRERLAPFCRAWRRRRAGGCLAIIERRRARSGQIDRWARLDPELYVYRSSSHDHGQFALDLSAQLLDHPVVAERIGDANDKLPILIGDHPRILDDTVYGGSRLLQGKLALQLAPDRIGIDGRLQRQRSSRQRLRWSNLWAGIPRPDWSQPLLGSWRLRCRASLLARSRASISVGTPSWLVHCTQPNARPNSACTPSGRVGVARSCAGSRRLCARSEIRIVATLLSVANVNTQNPPSPGSGDNVGKAAHQPRLATMVRPGTKKAYAKPQTLINNS